MTLRIKKYLPLCVFCVILFLFVGLILLSWLNPELQESNEFSLSHFGARGITFQVLTEFDRQEDQDNYHLAYGWTDFNGDSLNISFALSKNALSEAEEEFGYFPADLRKHMDDSLKRSNESMIEYLRDFVQGLIRKSGYQEYIIIEKSTANSFNLKLFVPNSEPSSVQKKVKREFDKIKRKLAKEQENYQKRLDEEIEKAKAMFFKSRGIRLFDGKIGVDHLSCVMRNQERIEPIFKIMREKYKKFSLHQFLGLLLSFVQDIRFYIPPLQEKGKVILSFWVPPRVLADNFGDCDSKGVTFACFWANFKNYPILLITVPNHFFVGLGIPSFSGEGFVINGFKYTLCEVTGPGKMPPGMIGRYSQSCLQTGQYQYEMIK